MSAPSLPRRGIACAMAVAGTMALGVAGVANAAPTVRPNTTLGVRQSAVPRMKAKHTVTCTLTNAATGAGINGAVIDLDRGGQPDHTGTTSDGGIVNFTVTVNSGTSATFQCLFPGNGSFVRSTSRIITVSTS